MSNIDLFKSEIKEIKNKEYRNIIKKVLKATPSYAFKMPASSSGEHHTLDELHPGGMVVHHKKCFRLSEIAARRYDIVGVRLDILKSACLIHDFPFRFLVDDNGEHRTNYKHPFLNAKFLQDIDAPDLMVAAVYFHMGRWADYSSEEAICFNDLDYIYKLRNDDVILATQEADYYCSRKQMIFSDWFRN